MPAAYRDIGATVFSPNNVANPTALAAAAPTSRVAGDLLVCLTASRSIAATVATPSGWTLLSGFPKVSGTASGGKVYAFAKVAAGTSADDCSPSWSGVTTGTSGDSSSATILAYSGANTGDLSTVLDGSAAISDAAVTTSITVPSVTLTNTDSLQIAHAIRVNDTAHTFTGGLTNERRDAHTTSGTGHGIQITDVARIASGATATATITPSNTTSSRALVVTFAIKSAPAPVTDSGTNTTLAALENVELLSESGSHSAAAVPQIAGESRTETGALAATGALGGVETIAEPPTDEVTASVLIGASQVVTVDSGTVTSTVAHAADDSPVEAGGVAATADLAGLSAWDEVGAIGADSTLALHAESVTAVGSSTATATAETVEETLADETIVSALSSIDGFGGIGGLDAADSGAIASLASLAGSPALSEPGGLLTLAALSGDADLMGLAPADPPSETGRVAVAIGGRPATDGRGTTGPPGHGRIQPSKTGRPL